MTRIELIAKDQELTADEKPVVASGNQNTVVIEVNYSDEWEGYAKSAVFFTENNSTAYEVAMDGDNSCIIPHEVLADVTKLYIGLRGVKGDEVKASSLVRWNIVKGAPVGEGTAVEATPTPYQQVLERTVSLQGQIDAIVIEATGSGDASAEVAQARTPEYGSPYGTLQARLNAADETDNFILDKIGDTYAEKILDNWILSSYIDTSGEIGSTVDLTPINTGGWRSMVVPVVAGDLFKISGMGGVKSRLWAFLDAGNVILSQATVSGAVTDMELTAEVGGYLVLNFDETKPFSVRRVYNTVEAVKADRFEVEQLAKDINSKWTIGKNKLNPAQKIEHRNVTATGDIGYSEEFDIYGKIPVKSGEKYVISHKGNASSNILYALYNDRGVFIKREVATSFTVEQDGYVYLRFIHGRDASEYQLELGETITPLEPFTYSLDNYDEEISRLETDILSIEEDASELADSVFERSTNLANTNSVTQGVVILTDGTVTENSAYRTSDYIKVTPGKQYVGSALVFLATYTADKVFIKRLNVNNGEAFTLGTNARYVRISSNVVPSLWQLNEGDTLLEYEPYSNVDKIESNELAIKVLDNKLEGETNSINEDLIEVTNAVFKRSTNIANTDSVTRGVVITVDGIVSENASYRTSDYVGIKSGEKYVGSALVFLAIYSEDKTFIKRINVTNGVSFTLPANAKYVRISSNAIPEKWQLNEGDTLLEYEPFEDVNRIENNELDIKELDSRISETERSLEVRTDKVDATYIVGRFNATGTINWAMKNAVRTKEPIYVEKGGTVSCGDGYQIYVLFYSEDVFSYETFISYSGWTTEAIVIPENTYVGLMIADMEQSEQSDTSIADNICWDIKMGTVAEVTQKLSQDVTGLKSYSNSPYYHGKLDIKQSSVNHWYTCLTNTEDMANDGFGVSGSFEEGVSNDITTYAHVIEKFDTLMALAPDYITKKSIGTAEGTDSNGNEYQIYEYTFKPRRRTIDLNTDVVPKILMDGGIHGFEKCAVYGLYYFMKDIVVNYSGNEMLETLRNHVEFHVVPVSNPWGFDRDVRNNANDVNLNRNFPLPNWTFYDNGSDNSGAEPLSEKESQALSNWILAHKDTMFMYMNLHTNGHYNVANYAEMNACMTATDTNDEYFNRIFKVFARHIEDQTAHWSDMYDNINPSYTEFCGKNQSSAGETHTKGELRFYISTYLKSNIAMVFEGFNALRHNDEQIITYHSRQAFKMNAENIGNMVAQMLCEYTD